MTADRAALEELGYLRAVVAQFAVLADDDGFDEDMLRRELRWIVSLAAKRSAGVAEAVEHVRGDRS